MPGDLIIPESQLYHPVALNSPVSDPTIGSSAGSVDYSLFNPSQADQGTKLFETANAMNWAPNPQDPSGVAPAEFKGLTNGNFSQSMTDGLNSIGSSIGSTFANQIPYGSKMSASILSKITKDASKGIGQNNVFNYGVQLVSKTTKEKFFCDTMPRIQESGSVTYDEINIAHHPGSMIKYITTPSRSWSISEIKLVSLTAGEATSNQNRLNLLRSWRMPYYGYGTEKDKDRGQYLGAPPEVLVFSAYGKQNIDKIPVVITEISWSWPNDVDYVHTVDGLPFPVLISVDITVKEAWSPRQFSGFDLSAFRRGDMAAAYNSANVPSDAEIYASNQKTNEKLGEAPKGENGVNKPVEKPPTKSTAAVATPKTAVKPTSKAQVKSGELGVCTAAEAKAAEASSKGSSGVSAMDFINSGGGTSSNYAKDAAASMMNPSASNIAFNKQTKFKGF